MKVSDYIVQYLIDRGIAHVFGYPGGMVTHLMDSLSKRDSEIASHVTYHEQGAAFAACGYAQASGGAGVAYATSGPGATNLVTGICNAWFDSLPVLFITGQVNTFESRGNLGVRQRGFQETDIVSMVQGVTKYSAVIGAAGDVKFHLDRAFDLALSGRKGPVLLDVPMDVFRSEIEVAEAPEAPMASCPSNALSPEKARAVGRALAKSKRPVILIGNGIKLAGIEDMTRHVAEKLGVPVVSSMLSVDVMQDLGNYFGFIGAYGDRSANFVVAKSDLVIGLGSRMDVRQVGTHRERFALNAKIVRVDIDPRELGYCVHKDDIAICADVSDVVEMLAGEVWNDEVGWLGVCQDIRDLLSGIDAPRLPNVAMEKVGHCLPQSAVVVTDVGQNQVWAAQTLQGARGRRLFTSGGHGAMGYALPAAIGCCLATGKRVVCISGDGGIQMNIQELQTVARERLPVKIVVFNNSSLGMIRHFQEMYFDGNYVHTTSSGGYAVPDFGAIARAYGIEYVLVTNVDELSPALFDGGGPCFAEVRIDENTFVFPKLEFGKPNQDQEPLLDRDLYERIMSL